MPALPPYGYIDIHTHIGRVWNIYPSFSADDLISAMDEHGVERAVLLPLVSPEASAYVCSPDAVLTAAQAHPDRLIAFCVIDPRTSFLGGTDGLRKMLLEYVDQGAKGFGEHKPGLPFDHSKMMEVYGVCEELKLPVLFHMDNERSTDSPGMPRLEHALKQFPNLPFIGHAEGFWANISGGIDQKDMGEYGEGPIKPGGAIDRLMDEYPNLYADLSAGSGFHAVNRDREFAREFLMRRAIRLLFGTDRLRKDATPRQFELLNSFDLPRETTERIFRQNALDLLNID